MFKLNFQTVAWFAVLIFAAGTAHADIASKAGSSSSRTKAETLRVQNALRAKSAAWMSAEAYEPLMPQRKVDVGQNQCRYLGGPKSMIPC
jgi:hypothetical protein